MKNSRKENKIKILIGYSETAGYFNSLNKGFRKLGIQSDFIDIITHTFGYEIDQGNLFAQLHKKISFCYEHNSNTIKRFLYLQLLRILRLFLFVQLLPSYDVFILSSFQTLLGRLDLPVLKFFGKKVIYVFLGTDSRPTYISGNVIEYENGKVLNLKALHRENKKKVRLTKMVERHADYFVNHPPSALFQTKPIILFSCIGFPFSKEKANAFVHSENENNGASVRIVHAPSKPLIKGSHALREIIAELQNSGHKIELIEIVNRPNHEVLEELSKCDFVVDEFYSDIPLGGLGTEAAFFGKPTINGGYYSVVIGRDYPENAIAPALYCLPEKMKESIELLITDKTFRIELGRKAKEFVNSNWESTMVAQKFMKLIYDTVPSEWFSEPSKFSHILGYGQSKEKLAVVVGAYVKEFGETALFLNDKPELLKQFRQLTGK